MPAVVYDNVRTGLRNVYDWYDRTLSPIPQARIENNEYLASAEDMQARKRIVDGLMVGTSLGLVPYIGAASVIPAMTTADLGLLGRGTYEVLRDNVTKSNTKRYIKNKIK